jgi:hypothetical protein
MAGDRGAAKAVAGRSKPYLEVAGRPLVCHAVAVLQDVPEVSEVWVVGDAEKLEAALGGIAPALTKPLCVVPQFRNLFENAWKTYRRTLPGAGPEGREPTQDEARTPYLYLSADIPFAVPQEISAFIAKSLEADCDYALGLSEARVLAAFGEDEPAFQTAYFNLREGRFRQNNLHLVKPARIGRRQLIGEMYEHRYQRELGNALSLAWQTLRREGGGFAVLYYYALMHVAGWFDRHGLMRAADRLRRGVSLPRVEGCISRLLATNFRFVVTEMGGCAIDIDNREQWDAARTRYELWRARQLDRAAALYGEPSPAAKGSFVPRVVATDTSEDGWYTPTPSEDCR